MFASEKRINLAELYEKNFGIEVNRDITKIEVAEISKFDILCAGFPCQPFSKAGKRDGLLDERNGSLFDKKEYSKETMLFFATSMGKSILGKFDYGNKLRSSQSLEFKMNLPTQNQQPNYAIMETLISAIQKMVIKDVVLYVDKKLTN